MTEAPIQGTIERAWREVAAIEEAFARGQIDEAGWHERMAALVVPAYLAGDNPRAQSGYGGTETDWRQARSLVADVIPCSGTFLDVGCASGLLMESVNAWCSERGLVVEPYGLEIAPELAALARERLPQWRDRVFDGNAASWIPPFQFDFVRTGHDYVPRARRRELLTHLRSQVVKPGGRLLIGPYTEERDETRSEPSLEQDVQGWGFNVAGRVEHPHPRDNRVVRRLIYLGTLPNNALHPAAGPVSAVALSLSSIWCLQMIQYWPRHTTITNEEEIRPIGEPLQKLRWRPSFKMLALEVALLMNATLRLVLTPGLSWQKPRQ